MPQPKVDADDIDTALMGGAVIGAAIYLAAWLISDGLSAYCREQFVPIHLAAYPFALCASVALGFLFPTAPRAVWASVFLPALAFRYGQCALAAGLGNLWPLVFFPDLVLCLAALLLTMLIARFRRKPIERESDKGSASN